MGTAFSTLRELLLNRMTYSLLTAFSLSLAGCGGSGQNTAALDAASGPVAVGAPTQLDFSAAVGDASASGNNTPPATVAMDSTSVSDGAALVPQLAASVTVVDGPSGRIASDYVLKPFSPVELMAKVKSQLRMG